MPERIETFVRALSIQCDAHAKAELEKLLGPATVVVENGGGEPRLYLHYRLNTPARSRDELKKLELARELAAGITDGVFDGLPPAHLDPKICRIISQNPDVEIDLNATLEILQKAAGNGGDPATADEEPIAEEKEDEPRGDPLTIARGYLKRGWNPIPVSRQTKKPIGNGWQHRRLTEETVAKVFNRADMNIGVQLGPMSNGLTDVDLDCREAVTIGPMLLPRSNNVFGRASKRRSHWLYGTTLADKIAKACLQFKDVDGTMMLELKIGGGGKGSQSVFPGSTHTSGEAVEWDQDGALVTIDDDMLLQQVRRLAVAVMLARHWPAEGARHDAALTVGGFLARAGLDEDEAALMLEAIAEAAGDEEEADRAQAARDAVKQHGNGGETRGLPKLVETFGEKVANKVAEWLGYQGGYESDNGLPDLVIGHEPTAVAKELAKLIAQGDHYFFNGNAPVRIAIEVNDMPRAIEVTAENVRVLAHEISNPVRHTKQGIGSRRGQDRRRQYLSKGARRPMGPETLCRHRHNTHPERRRDHPQHGRV